MENPATWNEIEKAIAEALNEHEDAMRRGVIGVSNVRTVFNKLAERGFIAKQQGPTVDHITYVVTLDTIKRWAWYYLEVLKSWGGKLTKKIDDADPTGKSSMMLWEIDFGNFAIALVAGIDREEKSHATVFRETHAERMVQHIQFRPPNEDLDALIADLEKYGATFQSRLLVRQEGNDLVKQVFLSPTDETVNPAESGFDELGRRASKDSPITFDENVAANLYRAAQELMNRDIRAPMLDWSLMPDDWKPPVPAPKKS